MRIYLDSSALIKRAVAEAESDALADALDDWAGQGDALVSSSLAWIEVTRALQAREGPAKPFEPGIVDDAMSGVAEHPISPEVVALARRVTPPVLRTLDAIHLASAIILDADVVVAYDKRLIDACIFNNFDVLAPGC